MYVNVEGRILRQLDLDSANLVISRHSRKSEGDRGSYAFYSGQILHSARKAAGITQSELAERINSTKSYISKLEKGHINPSAGLFFSIINALGMRVEIVKPV